jgi:hypothetical protein
VHAEAAAFEYAPAAHCEHDVAVPPLDAVPALHVKQDEPDLK